MIKEIISVSGDQTAGTNIQYLKYHKYHRQRLLHIAFTAVLIFQTAVLILIGNGKKDYNIDEIYTYVLSNSYKYGSITEDDDLFNRWIDGDELTEFVTVEKGERFAFSSVYSNNEKDAHPPLYYFIVHAVSSFFPGVFSKWIGIGINIALFAAAQVMLYLLSIKLFGSTLWALLPASLYGGTLACIDTAEFIRMYMLSVLLTTSLLYVHAAMLERPARASDFVLCFAVTFFGCFTHYYFAVTAFLIASTFCIRFAAKKQPKTLALYAISMLCGALLTPVLYPAAAAQITGSSTNNVGREISSGLLDFTGHIRPFMHMAKQLARSLAAGFIDAAPAAAAVLIASVAAAIILGRRKKRGKDSTADVEKTSDKSSSPIIAALAGLILINIIVVTYVSGKFSYIRYIYNIIPAMILVGVYVIRTISMKFRLSSKALACGLIAFSIVGSAGLAANLNCSFIMANQYENTEYVAKLCENRPMVFLGNGTKYMATGNFTLLTKCRDIYMANADDFIENCDDILSDKELPEGVVFIVLTDSEWSEGFDGKEVMQRIVNSSAILDDFTPSGECPFSEVYISTP